MAVSAQTPIGLATGNGVTTVFPFTYYVGAAADLVVQITAGGVTTTKTLGADYSISGAGNPSGGAITFTAAPAVGALVTHYRDTQLTRSTDYQSAGDLLAPVINLDFDRIWLALQEIFSGGKGAPTALRVPNGETVAALPPAADRASRILAFDGAGNPYMLVGVDASSAAALQLDLANTSSLSKGDAMLGVKKGLTGALATTQHALNEGRMVDLVADFGLVNDGVTTGNAARMATALASGAHDFWLPAGDYLWDGDVVLPNDVHLYFAQGAKLKASANGRTFFKSTVSAYRSKVFFANLDANGKTGCTGFDMVGFRHSAGIYYPRFSSGMQLGIYLRQLCWDTEIVNPWTQGCINGIKVADGSNAVHIQKPGLDGLGSAGNGIEIVTGGTYDTTSVRITGGYIQGYASGVLDGGIGSIIDGTYFETCTVADVNFSGAVKGEARNTQHYAAVGPVAIKGRSSDGIIVTNPTMSNGGRSTGLFDFDGTCANCYALRSSTAGGVNLPEGTVTGIGYLPTEGSGTFTPVVEGSTAAGAGTYTTQSGTWRRVGRQVHVHITVTWTAHTGTGNILLSGIPAALTPGSFTPRRVGQAVALVAYTGPTLYAYLNGTGTKLSLVQVSTLGAESLVPIAASGTVHINLVFDL